MKTLYTIYSNFAKRVVMSLMTLMTIGVTNLWADIYTATLTFDDLSKTAEGFLEAAENATGAISNVISAVESFGKIAYQNGDLYKINILKEIT